MTTHFSSLLRNIVVLLADVAFDCWYHVSFLNPKSYWTIMLLFCFFYISWSLFWHADSVASVQDNSLCHMFLFI